MRQTGVGSGTEGREATREGTEGGGGGWGRRVRWGRDSRRTGERS